MSLKLEMGTVPEGTEANMWVADSVDIGRITVSTVDFCELAMYVLTNTDLVENDPRLHLMNQLAKLVVIPGYHHNGRRLG